MFDEIDYVLEGKNAERFASLYGSIPCEFIYHIINVQEVSWSCRICTLKYPKNIF